MRTRHEHLRIHEKIDFTAPEKFIGFLYGRQQLEIDCRSFPRDAVHDSSKKHDSHEVGQDDPESPMRLRRIEALRRNDGELNVSESLANRDCEGLSPRGWDKLPTHLTE